MMQHPELTIYLIGMIFTETLPPNPILYRYHRIIDIQGAHSQACCTVLFSYFVYALNQDATFKLSHWLLSRNDTHFIHLVTT